MIELLKKAITEYNLVEKKLVIGFSGGVDSTALLDALSKTIPAKNLLAVHINHNWRGKESDKEEEAAKNFAKQLKIKIKTTTPPDDLKKTEDSARQFRYEFFKECAADFGATTILTAHTKSDNAETLIYRVAKGTGPRGLSGIPKRRTDGNIEIIRPLITISRIEIEDYIKKNNLKPCLDSSNNDQKYKRNLIRHSVLPALKKINSNYETAIEKLSQTAASEQNIIAEYIAKIKSEIMSVEKIDTKKYLNLTQDTKKRLIYELLVEKKLEYDLKTIEKLFDFIEEHASAKSGKKTSITKGLWLFANSEFISFIEKNEQKTLSLKIEKEGTFKLDEGIFSLKKFKGSFGKKFPKDAENKAYIDLSDIGFPLTLRYRNEGDTIKPLGFEKTIKLKKYLINKSVPNHLKGCIILLCKNNEALWVQGLGLSENVRVKTLPTHILELKTRDKI